MKKRILVLTAVIVFAVLVFTGCAGDYKITNISSNEDAIVECPDSANAGDTVKVETCWVTDAAVYVRINGENIAPDGWPGGEIEFVMPDEDVEIDVGVVSMEMSADLPGDEPEPDEDKDGGSGAEHNIIDISDEDYAVFSCPETAKAGETVTVETYCVEDATVYVRINDENIAPEGWGGGEIEFVMPDEDVEINVGAVSNGLA